MNCESNFTKCSYARKPILEANITFSNKNDNAYLNASQMDIIKKVLCNNSSWPIAILAVAMQLSNTMPLPKCAL